MSVAESIRNARELKGLSENEVADRAGLTIYEYGDVEAYDYEADKVLELKNLKLVCEVLDLDLYKLFSLDKPQNSYGSYDLKMRNEIIRDRRNALKLTHDELGEKVSFYGVAIQKMEADRDFLESWCLEDIIGLAKVLGLPSWVLIGR